MATRHASDVAFRPSAPARIAFALGSAALAACQSGSAPAQTARNPTVAPVYGASPYAPGPAPNATVYGPPAYGAPPPGPTATPYAGGYAPSSPAPAYGTPGPSTASGAVVPPPGGAPAPTVTPTMLPSSGGPSPGATASLPPWAAPAGPAPTAAANARPLLGALIGPAAWQAEARAVARELIAHLSPENAARVATIPLVFDPNPNEVNAFAGCDENGAPFVAGTEGLIEAIDAIAQTQATDELFGTRTYAAYVAAVAPRIVTKGGASAMLPLGIVPATYWLDPRRISRAHEMFDEIVAFTFGHELSHHYLGHTGCANGQAGGPGPAIAELGQLAAAVLPGLNQPNEIAADSNGCINTLDTGLARSAQSYAYRWTEEGGLWLLDFFAGLDRASGANPWLGFLRTHPNPALRIPIVQGVAATWRMQHPTPRR